MTMNKKRTLLSNQKLNNQWKRKVKSKKRNLRFLETMKMTIQSLNQNQSLQKNKLNLSLSNRKSQNQSPNHLKSQRDHFLAQFPKKRMKKAREFSFQRNQINQNPNQSKKLNSLLSQFKSKNQKKLKGWKRLQEWAVSQWWVWHKWFQKEWI